MTRKLVVALTATMLAAIGIPAAAAPPEVRPNGEHRLGDDFADTPLEVHELHDQHGGLDGHLPGSSENVELVGQVDIDNVAPERVADVSAFGNYAYLTVRDPAGCFDAGVAVIDISDPENPQQVGFIDATQGSFPGEGSQVVDLDTHAFTGQVLVFNNELCALGGDGGVTLWDVTDPLNPELLTAHAGDNVPGGTFSEFNQIHSAFAWQAGDRAFAVLVDNEEFTDIDIIEITDPTNPVLISETDANDFGVLQDNLLGGTAFLHDMVVKKLGNKYVLLLSYWDGGWLLFDVNDPANPQLMRDFDYPLPDSLTGLPFSVGNAHQAEFSNDGRLIIGTDEDFDPSPLVATITSGPFEGDVFTYVSSSDAPPITPEDPLAGNTVYVGRACSALPAAPSPDAVALVERGDCSFQVKNDNVAAAGYAAGIVFNVDESAGAANPCNALINMLLPNGSPIPFVFVTRDVGFKLLGILDPNVDSCETLAPAAGAPSHGFSIEEVFDGWGYVRLIHTNTMQEIDAFAIPEALDPAFEEGFGDLSVHEVAVDPYEDGLAYLSYYAGGLRVLRFDRNGMEEVGHYIDEDGNNFWGVEVHRLPGSSETLILGSDRDSGLWIFRYTGD